MYLSIIIVLFSLSPDSNFRQDLVEIRNMYEKAASNEKDAIEFADYMENKVAGPNVLIKGYKATSLFLMARYHWNPYSKFSYFNEGKKMLESAINEKPENTELRFLRIGIQNNVPGFLGYNEKINEDKTHLIQKLNKLSDYDLKKRIGSFLLQHIELTETEKKEVENEISKEKYIINTASF